MRAPRCDVSTEATLRILLVEDYEPLRQATARGLREQGHAVDAVADGPTGLTRALLGDYDAVVLDLMLPGVDGLQVLRTMRQRGVRSPVIVVTARNDVEDRVNGLDQGADDYLPKPFAMEELFARLRALIRRNYQKDPLIRTGHVEIDTSDHSVRVAGEPVSLSAREYAMLEYLAMRRDELVTRAELWNHLYDGRVSAGSNVIDVYISYLRRRIEREGHPRLIHTRRGEGYIFGVGKG